MRRLQRRARVSVPVTRKRSCGATQRSPNKRRTHRAPPPTASTRPAAPRASAPARRKRPRRMSSAPRATQLTHASPHLHNVQLDGRALVSRHVLHVNHDAGVHLRTRRRLSQKARSRRSHAQRQAPRTLRDIPTYCSAPVASYTAYTPEEAGSSGPTPELRVAGASAPDRASARHARLTAQQLRARQGGSARERDELGVSKRRHVRGRHCRRAAGSTAAVAGCERLASGRQWRRHERSQHGPAHHPLRRRRVARRRGSARACHATHAARGSGSRQSRRQRHPDVLRLLLALG